MATTKIRTIPETLSLLKNQIIVSVQADEGEPFYPPEMIGVLCQSVYNGGARAFRLANPDNIRYIKNLFPDIPVIGITKPSKIPSNAKDLVYITPTFSDIEKLAQAGADVVAMDATLRKRPNGETLASMIQKARHLFPSVAMMADLATLEEGKHAIALGFDILSTTLSGYTTETQFSAPKTPDFNLLYELCQEGNTPVIMEGRIWEPSEVKIAFEKGAFSVVIGSAITRPHLITERFCQAALLQNLKG